jgi:hypothetical protein
MKFKFLKTVLVGIVLSVSSFTNAGLISRLGGLAYYDDVADLTWLADANYAKTSGYSFDGLMNWVDANSWAAGLNLGGNDNWRLADTLQFDASCVTQTSGSYGSYGNWCTGSEMGSLFYTALGNVTTYLDNKGPFNNIKYHTYWTATQKGSSNTLAFNMGNGRTEFDNMSLRSYAWAVQSGDVAQKVPEPSTLAIVPEPSTLAILALGLMGLTSRRFKKQ